MNTYLKEYKKLKVNCLDENVLKVHREWDGCPFCGCKEKTTILIDRDICHECKFVYT